MYRTLILALALLAACGPAPERSPAERPSARQIEPSAEMVERAAEEFAAVRDGFLDWYFEAYPVRASELGMHAHDARLPAMDRMAVQDRIDDLLDWIGDLEEIPFTLVRGDDRYDYAIMEFALRAELLDLEEIRSWAIDPRLYTRVLASGIASLAQREHVSDEARLEALRSRMAAGPALLEVARANLRRPPVVWVEMALEDARGLAMYLETQLPARVNGGATAPLPSVLRTERDELVAALDEHVRWLEADLLPVASGDFRLGRYLFQRKLLYEEHISLSIEELSRLNRAAVTEIQQRVSQVAAEIDPARTPGAIADSVARLHPDPEALLIEAAAMMASLREWTDSAGVVTIPDPNLPTVRESPPYARSRPAYLDVPGPFESERLDAFYNLTTPLAEWGEERTQEYLTYFNRPALLGMTIHETFPGRYVQAGFEREVSSAIRRVFTPRSFTEGWAHYAEQMTLDEGYAGGDPVLRLGQLLRVLQRHARWQAALQIHALDASIEDVVTEFAETSRLPEALARQEVARATYEPTYLYDALGRMQILELRDDYREFLEQAEEAFSLREFHDALLQQHLPLPLVREVMMPTRPEPRPGR